MAERLEVYKCDACGNIVEVIHGGGGELVCCGEPMKLLIENTVDAAKKGNGTFLGPAVGGAIAASWGLRVPFLIFGAIIIVPLVLIMIVIPRTYTAVPTHAHNLFTIIRNHYKLLAAAGAGRLRLAGRRGATCESSTAEQQNDEYQ